MSHTQLPWAVEQGTQITCPSMPKRVWGLPDEYSANFLVVQTNLYVSADTVAQEANAQFIVRACNAHEGLLMALQDARSTLAGMTPSYKHQLKEKELGLKRIDAALATAKGA